MRGKIIWYAYHKGYGFVLGDDGQQYFLHRRNLISKADEILLIKDQTVEFDAVPAAPKWLAKELKIIPGAEPILESSTPTTIKRNPFTPQDPVTDPKKFGGRRAVLRNAVDALFNTKNLLITGPRGIGKSSLAYQLLYMTEGEEELLHKLNLDLGGFSFDYMIGDHRCTGDNTLVDIVNGLVANLASSAGIQATEQGKIVSGFDLKIFKSVEEKTSTPITASDLANRFVTEVERLFLATKNIPGGITFLIDEVDALPENVHLGPFLKASVEKFRLDGHHSICFIVSGVTGTATSLLMQHQSSARLFERIELTKMANEELEEVIDLTQAVTDVQIDHSAKSLLVSLANNFPQPLHLLGYHAFRLNADNIISETDVEQSKIYIVTHTLRHSYDEKLRSLGSQQSRDIIRIASLAPGAPGATVTVRYLSERLVQLSEHAIQSRLGELVKADILERHAEFYYGFREPLFRIYCRWVFGEKKL